MTQTEQVTTFTVGDLVVTYSGAIGKVLDGPWTAYDNGEQLVTVEVDGHSFQHGVAELELATVDDAWKLLQATSSYVEVRAAAWSAELGLEVEA